MQFYHHPFTHSAIQQVICYCHADRSWQFFGNVGEFLKFREKCNDFGVLPDGQWQQHHKRCTSLRCEEISCCWHYQRWRYCFCLCCYCCWQRHCCCQNCERNRLLTFFITYKRLATLCGIENEINKHQFFTLYE